MVLVKEKQKKVINIVEKPSWNGYKTAMLQIV